MGLYYYDGSLEFLPLSIFQNLEHNNVFAAVLMFKFNGCSQSLQFAGVQLQHCSRALQVL